MQAATSADKIEAEQSFWPSYVDSLVNVVMLLIVLIVILSIAVVVFTTRARLDATRTVVGPMVEKAFDPTPDPLLFPHETQPFPEGIAKGVQEFSLRPMAVMVSFRPGALDLSADEAERLAQLFKKHFDTAIKKGHRYLISADAAEGLSESSRKASYRVTAVRNRLVTHAGVSRDSLQQRVFHVPASEIKGSEALTVRISLIAVPATHGLRAAPASSPVSSSVSSEPSTSQ